MEQTAALLGVSLAQLVRAGALVYAKREFLGHKKYLSPSPAAAEGDSSQVALLRSGSGVAGVADTRIQAAFDALYFAVKLQGSNSVGRGPLPDYPNPLSPGLRPVLRTDSARDSLLWKAGSNEVSLHFLTTREVS